MRYAWRPAECWEWVEWVSVLCGGLASGWTSIRVPVQAAAGRWSLWLLAECGQSRLLLSNLTSGPPTFLTAVETDEGETLAVIETTAESWLYRFHLRRSNQWRVNKTCVCWFLAISGWNVQEISWSQWTTAFLIMKMSGFEEKSSVKWNCDIFWADETGHDLGRLKRVTFGIFFFFFVDFRKENIPECSKYQKAFFDTIFQMYLKKQHPSF